jgi:predicted AlkP superfamily pyrophosphatase or phosphodiesterase
LWGLQVAAQAQAPEAESSRHVIVISVDGMRASYYASPAPAERIPHIRELLRSGSYAEGVEGVYPTVTYPSHTTLVTGRLPAEHGIYTNLASREPGRNAGDWFWYASAIKVPTLWDKARSAHLTSGAVGWPVTVGAAIDWDVPEIWDPAKGELTDPLYVAKFMNPLFALEMAQAIGQPKPGTDTDVMRTTLAIYILKAHRPNLLLVHLEDLDATQHEHGPGSPQALKVLEDIDTHIGEIVTAAQEAALVQSTAVFIVSDHGFLPTSTEIAPNTLLVKAGLATAANHSLNGGKVFTVANGGSMFIYWPESENLRSQVIAALKPLLEGNLAWAVFGKEALKDLGAEPAAQMALEAPEGAFFSGRADGELVAQRPGHGTHGYLPFRSGLESTFIAAGPGIKRGINLHRIRMTSIAPTILRVMGISDPQFGAGPPLVDILEQRNK